MIRKTLTARLAASAVAVALAAACATADVGGERAAALSAEQHAALKAAIAAPTRTEANTARDRYRHPYETLAFFGVRPTDTVVELWPGGGWYTEILAPYVLSGGGTYYAAGMGERGNRGVSRLMESNPSLYGGIRLAAFPAFEANDTRVPDGSADVVLTFRNVHNWRMGYQRDGQAYDVEAFRQIYAMLRPGGTLGIVDHRLPENADSERERTSGYIKTSTIRGLAEQAGFQYVGASEVNANPSDTADWPDGVWTLPPSLGHGDEERYRAIGESDRMTLLFRKPE